VLGREKKPAEIRVGTETEKNVAGGKKPDFLYNNPKKNKGEEGLALLDKKGVRRTGRQGGLGNHVLGLGYLSGKGKRKIPEGQNHLFQGTASFTFKASQKYGN